MTIILIYLIILCILSFFSKDTLQSLKFINHILNMTLQCSHAAHLLYLSDLRADKAMHKLLTKKIEFFSYKSERSENLV